MIQKCPQNLIFLDYMIQPYDLLRLENGRMQNFVKIGKAVFQIRFTYTDKHSRIDTQDFLVL